MYRDGSRHQQVLHITSESKEKSFEVLPSDYVIEYISKNIKDEFVYKEVEKVIRLGERKEYMPRVMIPHTETVEEPCPLCTGKIVYIEGCNCCVECGWSSCVSG